MAILREVLLSRFRRFSIRVLPAAALFVLLAPFCLAEGSNPISLDTSETIFSVLTAINSCGYDQNLTGSDAQRSTIRAEVQRNLRDSEDAQAALTNLCNFYQAHRAQDATHELSQYISLALYLQGPPHFLPRVKEDQMPPDASRIAGFGAVLEPFYDQARLHDIWEHHRYDYAQLTNRYHEPLSKMIFNTEIYLKLASAQYLGRTFTVFLDFMGDPNEVNARNYGSDYYVVIFPSPDQTSINALKMEQIRHTYLHYLMDPLADKHYIEIKRLEPLLQSVRRAPLQESFKSDISLLVTECLIRAIEIRTGGDKHTAEAMRAQAVDDAVKQGYILTRYFYETLIGFEKDPAGIRNTYGDFLDAIDIKKEEKAASDVQFASTASPELLQLAPPEQRDILVTAEQRLHAGDSAGAQELAQEALTLKVGDQGRALFILAEIAVAHKDMTGARDNFQKAISQAKDPVVIAWSHVYLGRILDLKDDREGALNEYRAALSAGSRLPGVKEAAERGLDHPYEPPAKPE